MDTALFCDSQVNLTHILGRKEGQKEEGTEVERKGGRDLKLGRTPTFSLRGYPGASSHFPGYWEPLQHCSPQGASCVRASPEAWPGAALPNLVYIRSCDTTHFKKLCL